ncbi:hypothetical protein AB0M42_10190 [Streptomyces sp. NPDC051784]|uniref:hypothetical protein n=1 Tax=Streptomyces sp. NPDC051784 TaxID=3155805 RepID=UPI00341D62E0
MTATERRKEAAGRVRDAEDAVVRLRSGLAGVGVKLPSLRIDLASCTGDEPVPLVDLGRCSLETALRLSAALEEAAGHDS